MDHAAREQSTGRRWRLSSAITIIRISSRIFQAFAGTTPSQFTAAAAGIVEVAWRTRRSSNFYKTRAFSFCTIVHKIGQPRTQHEYHPYQPVFTTVKDQAAAKAFTSRKSVLAWCAMTRLAISAGFRWHPPAHRDKCYAGQRSAVYRSWLAAGYRAETNDVQADHAALKANGVAIRRFRTNPGEHSPLSPIQMAIVGCCNKARGCNRFCHCLRGTSKHLVGAIDLSPFNTTEYAI